MDELKTEIPGEKELSIIRYLLNEIDEERAYNNAYREEYEKARTLAKEKNSFYWCFMDRKKFPHDPRNSIIKSNIKLIRRLLLKVGKEVK